MKKILLIIPYIPYPLDSGGNQAFFNMVNYVRHKMDVSILLHLKKHNQQKHIEELRKLWPDVHFFIYKSEQNTIPVSQIRHPLYYKWLLKAQASIQRKIRRQLRSVVINDETDIIRSRSTLPHSIYEPLETGYINYVVETARQGFDFIQVEFYELISLGYVLPENVQTIFVHHELRYIHNENELALFKQVTPEDRMQFKISRDFEKDALSTYKHIITLTEVDRKLLTKLLKREDRIYASPAVINVTTDTGSPFVPATTYRLTFTGSESHNPNLDAVTWMCQEIIPRLRAMGIHPVFQVIGQWYSSYVKQLCANCPEMELAGYVEDLRSYIKGSIAVVPIRIGSGMRMKILEAVFAGIPFVTTSKGVEGINLQDGQECLVADNPDSFAKAIARLLKDTQLQEKLAMQAAEKMKEIYNPQQMLKQRTDIYNSILPE